MVEGKKVEKKRAYQKAGHVFQKRKNGQAQKKEVHRKVLPKLLPVEKEKKNGKWV